LIELLRFIQNGQNTVWIESLFEPRCDQADWYAYEGERKTVVLELKVEASADSRLARARSHDTS